MKFLKGVYVLVLCTIMGFALNSCSDSSDDGPLAGEAGKFCGSWGKESNSGQDGNKWRWYTNWIFHSDGTCEYQYYYYNDPNPQFNEKRSQSGTWTYDETTKILSTSISSYCWIIMQVNEDSWTGITVGGNPVSQSFNRDAYYTPGLHRHEFT